MAGTRAWRVSLLVMVVVIIACVGCRDSVPPHASVERLIVTASWNDADLPGERKNFMAVLDRFSDETGIPVTYSAPANRDAFAGKLVADIGSGHPPDVALLPQPGLLHDLAGCPGVLTPLPNEAADTVRANYADQWIKLGTVGGTLYGVMFKAANKSVVWYHPPTFQAAGVTPPVTWEDFLRAAQSIAAFGVRPVAIGGADQWVLTDWFENVYLRLAGPDSYDALVRHDISWTDPMVRQALSKLGELWGQRNLIVDDPATMSLDQSVEQVFKFHQGAMVVGADFLGDKVAGIVGAAQLGEEAEIFNFPSLSGSQDSVVAGGDIAVMTHNTPAAARLMQFLATPDSARVWAAAGGLISPNKNLGLDVYPDVISRQSAKALQAAKVVRFDLSDQLPPEFGSTEGAGLRASLHDLLGDPTAVETVTNKLELIARSAYSKPPTCPK